MSSWPEFEITCVACNAVSQERFQVAHLNFGVLVFGQNRYRPSWRAEGETERRMQVSLENNVYKGQRRSMRGSGRTV